MKGSRTAFVLLLFLMAASTAMAQTDVVAQDPSGDVVVTDGTVSTPAPNGYENIDIVEAWIGAETDTSFDVGIKIQGTHGAVGSLPRTVLLFEYGGVEYQAIHGFCQEDEVSLRGGPNAACVPAVVGPSAWQATIQKSWIVDADRFPIHVGSVLDDWHATGLDHITGGFQAWDVAPDDAMGEPFLFELGTNRAGDLTVEQPSLVRASNGGPDTFLYHIRILNQGETQPISLEARGVPDDWTVRLPPAVNLPAGALVEIPVVVASESAHAHGGTKQFDVAISTIGEPLLVQVGIHYLDVPQLAGHHSTLYVHAGQTVDTALGQNVKGWFNTVADDPDEGQRWLPSDGSGFAIGGNTYLTEGNVRWSLPLDPSLLIGMDFDLSQHGEMATVIQSAIGATEAILNAKLWHCDADNDQGESVGVGYQCTGSWFVLANGTSEVQALEANGQTPFSIGLQPTTYADLVPHGPGDNIAIHLELTFSSPQPPGASEPELDTEQTVVDLPLLDYRDPVDASFQDTASLRLEADQVEKSLNPGQRGWITFDLHNAGDSPRELALSTVGRHTDWLTPLPVDPFVLGAGQMGTVAVQIDVPLEASAGESLAAFLIAEDTSDPLAAAMARISVIVTDAATDPEVPPSGLVTKDKPTPAASPLLLTAGLAGAAFARRRLKG